MTPDGSSWDEAVARLEEVLAAHSFDRPLPPVEQLLAEARMDPAVLADDERALKILSEAVLARPLSTVEAVQAVRTEVEFLAVEVGMIQERLAGEALSDEALADTRRRLDEIRDTLDEVTEDL